ncbi:TlpA family protein disulfide reductase [Adhaeribacter terreus]|uniref:TlpA family protein disulfide reductase n=1 Tax=Adhaeribacter terreus TaxID=529703 RepID=A0ABW0E6G4_9BACT
MKNVIGGMKQSWLKLFLLSLIFLSGSLFVRAQEVKVIKFAELQALRNNPSDTLFVMNFWATWCKPCVKELPYFEAINTKYKGQPVKVMLVSMDSKKDLQTKVLPFVKKRNLRSDLYLLDEPDANSWIDKLELKWSGAIPATIFFNNQKQLYRFEEKEFHEAELYGLVDELNAKK